MVIQLWLNRLPIEEALSKSGQQLESNLSNLNTYLKNKSCESV